MICKCGVPLPTDIRFLLLRIGYTEAQACAIVCASRPVRVATPAGAGNPGIPS